jgi:hypothetical protein
MVLCERGWVVGRPVLAENCRPHRSLLHNPHNPKVLSIVNNWLSNGCEFSARTMIGPVAVPELDEYLHTSGNSLWARVAAAHALAEVGQRHPEARDDCVGALVRALESFSQHDPTLNGFLVSYLADLKAVEAAPIMEKAFAADCVDISIQGDWEDTQIWMGLLEERQTPKPHYVWLPNPVASQPRRSTQPSPEQAWKQEQKAERRQKGKRRAERKRQKQARKKQRKRK